MKHAFMILVLALPLAGCFIRTGPPTRTVVREERVSCPPAHHYENGACVHNGHGHGDHDDDDHGHGHGHGHGHD